MIGVNNIRAYTINLHVIQHVVDQVEELMKHKRNN